ncbi:MAG TPA: hypothetical protein VGI69_06335 [Gaiellaceae bacterium]
MTRRVLLVLCLFALSGGAARAGGGGGGDVRVGGNCARGATASLRLQASDDRIEARFRLRQDRGRGLWRITFVHENRVSSRATRTTTRSGDSWEVRRMVPDLRGSDTIAVHAWGPKGLGCRAAATLPDRG